MSIFEPLQIHLTTTFPFKRTILHGHYHYVSLPIYQPRFSSSFYFSRSLSLILLSIIQTHMSLSNEQLAVEGSGDIWLSRSYKSLLQSPSTLVCIKFVVLMIFGYGIRRSFINPFDICLELAMIKSRLTSTSLHLLSIRRPINGSWNCPLSTSIFEPPSNDISSLRKTFPLMRWW
jgi:hypothetical protein